MDASVRGSTFVIRDGLAVCGIARGPGDWLFLAAEGSSNIFVARGSVGGLRALKLTGDVPQSPCVLTAVRR